MENSNDMELNNGDFKKSYQWRIWKVIAELVNGFEFITNFDFERTITVWGSARIKNTEPAYKLIEKFGALAAKNGYRIVSGGGGGMMEAANKGCYENGGKSIGLNIKLPYEQTLNNYLTASIEFKYFFVRKLMLSFISRHYLFAPGGFGTFDELFEIITLAQTKKMKKKINVILIDKAFWEPIFTQIEGTMMGKYKTISKEDLDICQFVDTPEEAMKIIMNNK